MRDQPPHVSANLGSGDRRRRQRPACWPPPAWPAKRWKMRLSTSSVQFSSLPVEKACERIASLGFEAVDFWPATPAAYAEYGCPHLERDRETPGSCGLKELLAKHHLKLCALTCYFVGYRKYAELLGKVGGGVAVRESRDGKVDQPHGRNEGVFRSNSSPSSNWPRNTTPTWRSKTTRATHC